MHQTDDKLITRRETLRRMVLTSGAFAGLPLMSTLSACSPEVAKQLSPHTELLAEISELIIPETDTAGAKSAGVPAYIQSVVGTYYSEQARNDFLKNLKLFDEMAHSHGVESFIAAPKGVQQQILSELDARNNTSQQHEIWHQLRSMVIFGYYTSEAASDELLYDPVPGKYDGSVDFNDIGRAWLINGI